MSTAEERGTVFLGSTQGIDASAYRYTKATQNPLDWTILKSQDFRQLFLKCTFVYDATISL